MRVAIIGGGAAGMMAAAEMAETKGNLNLEIFLIEKNPILGKKVLISGGGRCNVTTGLRDVRKVLENYPRGGKFLNSAMHKFTPEMVFDWFQSHGPELKVEEDLRVFPVSNKGKDVVQVFDDIFKNSGVNVLLNTEVKEISKSGEKFELKFKDGEALEVDFLVLTTGGQTYRQTGSTGDGYNFAEALGHTITELQPSLNSFLTREEWPKSLSGVSFKRAALSVKFEKKYTFSGPFLFTHRGVSGPAVFALSGMIAFENYGTEETPVKVFIDVLTEISQEELRVSLQKEMNKNPKQMFGALLSSFVPKSLAKCVMEELKIDIEKKNAEVSKKEFNLSVEFLKNMPITVIGKGAGDEFVTAGGVELNEVDSKTMESKNCPGLYFAGEILNVDGYTGGYNLQASWATGRLVGESIINKIA